ncbi:MAG: class I SAM-dependent methyltransferase [Armatimonadetes bacterium]|nr:class I SAM-dependent methyltransferase [Armatimonadota bacterium]
MKQPLNAVGGRAVEVALELGLFQVLGEGPADPEALSRRIGASERGLRPLLYLLTSLGLLDQDGEDFSQSAESVRFLAEQWPAQQERLPRSADWEDLDRAVRTGRCVRPPIEGAADGGQFFSGVVTTLFQLHWPMARHLGAKLPQTVARVLDLGAGSAVWSLGLVTQRPEVRAVALDHDRVLNEVTTRFITDRGVADRYELRAGSYHEQPLEAEAYDVVYLGHVIHSEGAPASRRLLQRARGALAPGGLLVIAEVLGSEPRGQDYHANLFDLNMLMFTENGQVFTAGELGEMARAADFGAPQWVRGPGQYPVMLASRDPA